MRECSSVKIKRFCTILFLAKKEAEIFVISAFFLQIELEIYLRYCKRGMNYTMQKRIEFCWGNEKRIKISEVGRKDSLFYEGYRQALARVTEIVQTSVRYEQQTLRQAVHAYSADPKSGWRFYESTDSEYYNYPNNMIVFCGSRGSGKSSAMQTFVSSLSHPGSIMLQEDFITDMVRNEMPVSSMQKEELRRYETEMFQLLNQCAFIPLDPIDPTTLETKHGEILTVILSRMFHKASEIWESKNCEATAHNDSFQNMRNKLTQLFSDCYEYVREIKGRGEKYTEYNGLDVLARLGDSSHLKMELAELIQMLLYAQTTGRTNRCEPFLVLPIDDTDMNFERAYEILEDIRKYMVIPRLIIVMAMDMEHLANVVEANIIRSYGGGRPNEKFVEVIGEQYIVKLFPQSHQIHLPQLDVYLHEHADTLSLEYYLDESSPIGGEKVFPDTSSTFIRFQEQLFRLIYRKTGMVFLCHGQHMHYIVPDNMRLLNYFLTMLIQMQDTEDADAQMPNFYCISKPSDPDEGPVVNPSVEEMEEHLRKLQARLQNIQRFRDYFFSTWAGHTLDKEEQEILHILANTNLANKVSYICDRLCRELNVAIPEKTPLNYAVMTALLDRYAIGQTSDKRMVFAFAVHMYFSFLTHGIVLERLIAYYKKQLESRCTGIQNAPYSAACSFQALYNIVGSRIFSYTKDVKCENLIIDDALVKDNDGTANMLWHYDPFNNKGTHYDTQQANIGKIKDDPLGGGSLAFLDSMLLDFESDSSAVWADLCSSIPNALYLGENTPVSEYFKTFCAKGGHGMSVPSSIKLDTWVKVQSDALLTVLNFDVRRLIQRNICKYVVPYKSECRIREKDFPTLIQDFYYGPATLKAEDGSQFPIMCLNQYDPYKWLSCLVLEATTDETNDHFAPDELFGAVMGADDENAHQELTAPPSEK